MPRYGSGRKMKRKPYGRAQQQVREALAALPTPPGEDILQAAALLEDLYLRGFSAIQNGEMSFEAVTAAVQQAVRDYDRAQAAAGTPGYEIPGRCTVVATFMDSGVYEEEGKFYRFPYRLVGTAAEVTGEPEEVTAEFVPPPASLSEGRERGLIEARPAGTLRAGALNRDLNIIEGTVLITAVSQNGAGKGGRRYSDEALRKIAAMSEGLPAYLNHVPSEQAFKPRDIKDLIGVHRNVRLHLHEGKITSDLHVMAHQAPLVFGIAEKLGDHVGNSLVSRGLVQMEGDTEVVKDVVAVRSADLVSDPATTKGLFESRQGTPPADPFGVLIAEIREAITNKETETMELGAILTFLKDKPDQQALLAQSFGFVPAAAATKLQEERAGLQETVAALTGDRDQAISALKEAQVALDGYKAQEALAGKRAKIRDTVQAHALGKEFGKNADVVSDAFLTMLEDIAPEKWGGILDERLKSVKAVPAAGGGLPSSSPKPDALLEGQEEGSKPLPQGIHARLAAALALD